MRFQTSCRTVGLLCVLAFMAASLRADPEFRALWADAFNNGFKNTAQSAQLIRDARAGNFNAVIVEVRKRGDAYYESLYEPKAPELAVGYDPLADLIARAHDTSQGPRIEVHAWIVAYPIWNSTNANPTQPNHPYLVHPEWLTKSDTGVLWNGGNYVFDPAHPGVQEHTYNVCMDLVSRYDIDGLNFDYIRYQGNTWGYNAVAVQRFNTRFGRSGQPAPTDAQWLQFRRDQVTALVRKVYLSSIALKPQIKISADTICFAPGVTTDAQWPGSDAFGNVLQDWRSWMQEGILDLNIPMMYFDHPTYASAWNNWSVFAKDHRYQRHVALGPGIYLNTISNSLVQIRSSRIPTANGNKADGVSGYSYHVTNDEGQSRSNFLAALTRTNVSLRFESNPIPVFPTPTNIPVMLWKTAPMRGHLKGAVRNSSTAQVLENVNVVISGPQSRTSASDATGFYGSVDMLPGNYIATASAPGFFSSTASFFVTAGNVARLDFQLAVQTSNFPPAITSHPTNTTVARGGTATLAVTATGDSPLGYQWFFNGTALPGQNASTYSVAAAGPQHEGVYFAQVTNRFGSQISSNALLSLISPFSNIVVSAGATEAVISWTTALPGQSWIEYGTTTNLTRVAVPVPISGTAFTAHLSALIPSAAHWVRIRAVIGGEEFRSALFSFRAAGDLIVDNPEAGFTGIWTVNTLAVDKYQTNYRYAGTVAGTASATAIFRPTIATPGRYDIYEWHSAGGNRAINVPVTLVSATDGTRTTAVNQMVNGGSWQRIATNLHLAAGTNSYVRLGNGPAETGSKVVIADAIRFAYLAEQDRITGTPPEWWTRHFLGGLVDVSLDPDGDGYSTASEFVLGTSPNAGNSRLTTTVERTNNLVAILFSPMLAGRTYQLTARTNLHSGTWTDVSGVLTTNSFDAGVFSVDPRAEAQFYRIKVTPQ